MMEGEEKEKKEQLQLVSLWIRVPLIILVLLCANMFFEFFWEPFSKRIAYSFAYGSAELYAILVGVFAVLNYVPVFWVVRKIFRLKKRNVSDSEVDSRKLEFLPCFVIGSTAAWSVFAFIGTFNVGDFFLLLIVGGIPALSSLGLILAIVVDVVCGTGKIKSTFYSIFLAFFNVVCIVTSCIALFSLCVLIAIGGSENLFCAAAFIAISFLAAALLWCVTRIPKRDNYNGSTATR